MAEYFRPRLLSSRLDRLGDQSADRGTMRPAENPVYPIIFARTVQASVLVLALHWLLHWPLTGPRALGLFFTPALCLYFVFVFVAPWSWGLPILTRLAAATSASR